MAELAHDDQSRLGALEDPQARPTDDDFFSFDDLDEQARQRTAGAVAVSAPEQPPEAPPTRTLADWWRDRRRRAAAARAGGPEGQPTDASDDDLAGSSSAQGVTDPDATQVDEVDWHDDDGGRGDRDEPGAPGAGVYDDGDWSASGESARSGGAVARAPGDPSDAPGGPERSEEPAAEQEPGEPRPAGAARMAVSRWIRRGSSGEGAHRQQGAEDLRARWAVGLAIAVVAAALLWWGAAATMVLVVAVVLLAAVEYFNALRRAGWQSATLLGLATCVAFPLAAYWRGSAAFPLLAFLSVTFTLLWFLAGAGGREARVVEGAGSTLLGIGWIGGLAAFAAMMLRVPDGRGLLLVAVLGAVAYDVAGFLVGRQAGQTPLSEASPNKTKEGLAGGMVACLVVTLFVVGLFKIGPYDGIGPALLLGIAMAVAAPLGDLCESLLKRDLGVKDMSAVLPGHGGVLDRFDALLFVLPTVFYVVSAVGHKI